ncbi:MAG: hypothetical protein QM784_04995 [Polyangiaceae bacterium]
MFFVPLVPTSSWVILDTSQRHGWFDSQRKGLQLGRILWRSAALAWVRLALSLLIVLSIVLAATLFGMSAHFHRSMGCFVLGGSCVAALVYSYRGARATLADLDALESVSGFPGELLRSARLLLSVKSARSAPSMDRDSSDSTNRVSG